MKKKTLLSIGAVAVALGLGVTAMNAGSLLTLPFAAVLTADETPTVAYLKFSGALPENESIVPNWKNMQSCSFNFTNANPGTFPGIEVDRECAGKILVQRSSTGSFFDDSTIWEIDPADKNAVFVDSKFEGRLNVVFPEPLTIFGSAASFTYYKVILPEGLVKKARGVAVTPEEGDAPAEEINKSLSVEYTVKRMAAFTTVPKSGAKVSTLAGGLLNAKIEYEAGTEVSIADASKKAVLYRVNPAASPSDTQVGTYSLSVSGTTVDLTYDSNVQPDLTTGTQTYKIVVPEGAINARMSTAFFGDINTDIVIDNLGLVFMDIESLEIVGMPAPGSDFPVLDTPKEFTVKLPAPMSFGGKKASICPEGSSSPVANYSGAISSDGLTVTYTMDQRTSNTSKLNYPEWWSSGKYVLSFPASSFTDKATGKSSPKMDTQAWNYIDGISVDPFTYMTGNVSRSFYDDGKKVEPNPEVVYSTQSQLEAIPAEFGIASWTIRFLSTCQPDPQNTTAKIRLMKEGQSEPLFEEGTSEMVGGTHHLWKSSTAPWTTKVEEKIANSQSWVIFYNITDEPWYATSAAGPYKYRKYDFLKTPGKYTLVVDEGFFVDKSGIPSQAIAAPFTIIGAMESTLAPAGGSTLESLQTVTITYPEGATVNVPADTKIQLARKFNNSNKDAYLPYFKVTGEGNVVTIALDEPFTLSGEDFKVSVPGNIWQVTYEGETQPNAPYEAFYNIYNIQKGTVTPAPNMDGEPIYATALSEILYTASCGIAEVSGSANLYSVVDNNRTKVATYSAQAIASGFEANEWSKTITWTTKDDLSEIPAGDYVFEIPSGTLTYAGYISNYKVSETYTFDYKFRAPAPKFNSLFDKVYPTTPQIYTIDNGGSGFSTASFEFKNAEVKAGNSDAKIEVLFEGNKVAEFSFSSPAVTFEAATETMPGILELNFAEISDYNFATVGTYTLVVPDGLFVLNGEDVVGQSYEVAVVEKPVDFTYTLSPEAGSEVESLGEITLVFPNADNIMYSSDSTHPVATLTSEDGTQVLPCVYPTSDYNNTLTLKFGDTDTEWIKGKYTLTVNKGAINLGNPQFDDSVLGSGNFEGLTAEYNYIGATHVDMPSITEYINLAMPNSSEANLSNTQYGMGMVGFNLKTKDFEGVAGADFLQFYYQADENSERELLTTVNADNGARVLIIGGGLMDDDDLPSFQPVSLMYIMLCGDGDEVNEEELPQYMRQGYYTLVIPDGAFKADGKLLSGTSIKYHFVNEVPPFDMEYVLTPDPEVTIEKNAGEVFGQSGTGISIQFPEASSIDYEYNPATLTCPNNDVLTRNSPTTNWTNKLTWKFGTSATKWTNGEYVFEILPGKIGVNQGDVEDWTTEGNFPGLKVIYNVADPNDPSTGIIMIGVDKADAYNVFTLDGKIVKINAKAENMLDLEPGMYIINGKKAIVRK
ncbi:MAG: hypothetical protein K2M31_01075 [Muribaculaceae bacterium]|nr:hypothetical protein [Muribaculaceae bacterium]